MVINENKKTITSSQEAEVRRILNSKIRKKQSKNASSLPSYQVQADRRKWRKQTKASGPLQIPDISPENHEANINEDQTNNDVPSPVENTVASADQQVQQGYAQRLHNIRQKIRSKKQSGEAGAGALGTEGETGGRAGGKKGMGMFTFGAAFVLAAVKDIIDFFTLGWIGTIINIVVVGALLLIMLFSSPSTKEFLKKRKVILAGGAFVEFLPVLSFVPVWTLAVIWSMIESRIGKVSLTTAAKKASPMLEKTVGKVDGKSRSKTS